MNSSRILLILILTDSQLQLTKCFRLTSNPLDSQFDYHVQGGSSAKNGPDDSRPATHKKLDNKDLSLVSPTELVNPTASPTKIPTDHPTEKLSIQPKVISTDKLTNKSSRKPLFLPISKSPTQQPAVSISSVSGSSSLASTSSLVDSEVPSKAPVSTVTGNYCGSTFSGSLDCHKSCPNGVDSDCSTGEHCFASITCPVSSPTGNSDTPTRQPSKVPTTSTSTPVVSMSPVTSGPTRAPASVVLYVDVTWHDNLFLLTSISITAPAISSISGFYWWTWSSTSLTPPSGTNIGIAFSGFTDPTSAVTDSAPFKSLLPGLKFLSLGGGNAAGRMTASALSSIETAIRGGVFAGYDGLCFDVEEGDSGLVSAFQSAFSTTKANGMQVLVTISHSQPYGISDAATLMTSFFADTNIDYLSPQLYTTGTETTNDFTNVGTTWTSYATAKAKIVPSIVCGSYYGSAVDYFSSQGVTLSGYVQWKQTGCPSVSPVSAPVSLSPVTVGSQVPSKAPVSTVTGNYCGSTYSGSLDCHKSCPNGVDSDCSTGEHCFASITCPPSKVPTTSTSTPVVSMSPVTSGPSLAPASISYLAVSPTISIYIPEAICKPENCPVGLGTCVDNKCVYAAGYDGLKTHPIAYATEYCTLSPDGCLGVTHINTPYTTAKNIATSLNLPICYESNHNEKCVGIFASSPMMFGNSQEAIDPSTGRVVSTWGMGLTEASGICHKLVGPNGQEVIVAQTDRCGGYCTCTGLVSKQECGPCVNKADLTPGCPCVGTDPLYGQCCGLASYGCPAVDAACDWCASNNHPHFDLDVDTFDYLCGSGKGAGSCQITSVTPFQCMTPLTWPPTGASGTCGTNAFSCTSSPAPEQPLIPGCNGCCCYWGKTPSSGCGCI
eukprot:gene7854-16071_t